MKQQACLKLFFFLFSGKGDASMQIYSIAEPNWQLQQGTIRA